MGNQSPIQKQNHGHNADEHPTNTLSLNNHNAEKRTMEAQGKIKINPTRREGSPQCARKMSYHYAGKLNQRREGHHKTQGFQLIKTLEIEPKCRRDCRFRGRESAG